MNPSEVTLCAMLGVMVGAIICESVRELLIRRRGGRLAVPPENPQDYPRAKGFRIVSDPVACTAEAEVTLDIGWVFRTDRSGDFRHYPSGEAVDRKLNLHLLQEWHRLATIERWKNQ